VRTVLRKGLSIEPDDRYPDMRTLIDALHRTRAPAGASADVPPKQRNWFAYALCVAAGVVLGVYGLSPRRSVEPAAVHEPERSEPAPPEQEQSPCVLDGREPQDFGPTLVSVCESIRKGEIDEAHELWKDKRDEIDKLVKADHAADAVARRAAFAADSSVVARTFDEQATLLEASNSDLAARAARWAGYWAAWAERPSLAGTDQP
jgi:hypothetical protein